MAKFLVPLTFPLEYRFELEVEADNFRDAIEKAKAEAFARALPVPEDERKKLLLAGPVEFGPGAVIDVVPEAKAKKDPSAWWED